MIIRKRAYARAGLIGNPSDGYYGKTISIIAKNFRAEVTLYESPNLAIIPDEREHSQFPSIQSLAEDVKLYGYYGGVRLLKATIKMFYDYCQEAGVKLPDRNFTLSYKTNIPRHVGLAGSSAIITATLRALLEFYEIEIPKPVQPTLILDVERQELAISAGLQDRVIQVYEGAVYMDFAKELLDRHGYGDYEPLDPNLLPPLYIAYRQDASELSNVFHNDIRQRYDRGEADVVEAMGTFAGFAQQSREALLAGRRDEVGPLMDKNFDLRASFYRISDKNLALVEVGRRAGANVKFSGSGGAVIGTYRDQEMFEVLEEVYEELGAKVIKPVIV